MAVPQQHVDGCHNKVDVHARYAMFSDRFGEPCDCATVPAVGPINTDTMSLRQLAQILEPEIMALDHDGFEYFALSIEAKYTNPARLDQPIGRYRWIACYAVTGGSEGHYVHVDRLYLEKEYDRTFTIEPILLIKTFGGYDRACQIAAHIGKRLGV